MFSEVYKLIQDSLKSGKHTKKLAVFFAVLLLLLLFLTQYYLKGSLSVSVKGMDGNTTLKISKLSDKENEKPRVKEYLGRSISLRLSPGSYRIEASVVDRTDPAKTAKTIKYTKVVARKSTNNEVTTYQSGTSNIKDTVDRASNINLYKDKVDVTTVYGVTSIYDLVGTGKETIRKEPAFLNRVVGLCRFDNGSALAVDSNGEFYGVKGTNAQDLNIAQYASIEQLSVLEQAPKTDISGTNDFNCKTKSVLVYGSVLIDDTFSVRFIDRSADDVNYFNLTNDGKDNVWSYDRVDSDSFDHDDTRAEGSTLKKSIRFTSVEGAVYTLDIGTYISMVSPLESTKFCYFYKSSIGCGDVKTGTHSEIVKLEENREVTNLVSIDSNRVVYSLGSSVMLYDINTEESSELYSSDYTVIPYTMRYDNDQGILVFGTQKITSKNSSYNLPVISLR